MISEALQSAYPAPWIVTSSKALFCRWFSSWSFSAFTNGLPQTPGLRNSLKKGSRNPSRTKETRKFFPLRMHP